MRKPGLTGVQDLGVSLGVSTGVGGGELRGWDRPCVEGCAHPSGQLLLAAAARPICPSHTAHTREVWGAGSPL